MQALKGEQPVYFNLCMHFANIFISGVRLVVHYCKSNYSIHLQARTDHDSVQTHYMKGIEFHTNFSPQSCSRNISHMAATLGAGEQDDDVFEALAKHEAVTVGGTYDVCFCDTFGITLFF